MFQKVFPQVLIREQFYPGREFLKSNVWGQTMGSWEVRVGHTLGSPASWTGLQLETDSQHSPQIYWIRISGAGAQQLHFNKLSWRLQCMLQTDNHCCGRLVHRFWRVCVTSCAGTKRPRSNADHCNELWSLSHSSGLSLRLTTLWELKKLEVYISST